MKFKKFTFLYHAWCACKVLQSRDIVGLLYLRIPYLRIQPTKDQKKKKKSKNFQKENLSLPYTSNYLHSIYIVFTTIYIAFTFH